jgi:hypothetical protein
MPAHCFRIAFPAGSSNSPLSAFSFQLSAFSFQLSAFSFQLAACSLQLAARSFQLAAFSSLLPQKIRQKDQLTLGKDYIFFLRAGPLLRKKPARWPIARAAHFL